MLSSPIMVEFDHVSKRYNRSRRSGGSSLRDTIPAVARRLVSRQPAATSDGLPPTEFYALKDVTFDLRHGESMGLIGHNGAGKSTILKLLAGVTAPTQGHARVNGRYAALIELGAGFHHDLTGRENVYLNGSIMGLKRAEISQKLDSIIDFAGIEQFIDMPLKRYSSGMQARLGFAVAAHTEPEVLLIDEVLSVGDYAFQQKCLKKMEEFRQSGTAIVFVSHNMHSILSMCSKTLLLHMGQVRAFGPTSEVIETYTTTAQALSADQHAAQTYMKLLSADVQSSSGRPSQTFISGDELTVTLRLRAQRALQDPLIGIALRNAEAITVYQTDSGLQRSPVGLLEPGDEIVASFPLRLNLCNGMYSLIVDVIPSEAGQTIDSWQNIITFDVIGYERGAGIADLNASFSYRRIPVAEAGESSIECDTEPALPGSP